MDKELQETLSIRTFVMQFYFYLARGFFTAEETDAYRKLNDENVNTILRMKNPSLCDDKYLDTSNLIEQTDVILQKAKGFLSYKQKATDIEIAIFLHAHPELFLEGITLHSLRNLLHIDVLFKNGYMLQDVFMGYPEKNMYMFLIDCLDYVHSAAHFYNEGYDYYHVKKTIKTYKDIRQAGAGKFEHTRIQLEDEVMMRNFREAYINIILYIECFINSVGYDGYLSGASASTGDQLKLRGIQGTRSNGRYNYSSLTNKIENISRIIGGSAIDVSIEPYASYLAQDVELRNSHVHSSPDKPKKHFSIEGWKQKCDEMIETKCQLILNAFWNACYRSKPFPRVIFNAFHGNAFKGIQHKMVAYED